MNRTVHTYIYIYIYYTTLICVSLLVFFFLIYWYFKLKSGDTYILDSGSNPWRRANFSRYRSHWRKSRNERGYSRWHSVLCCTFAWTTRETTYTYIQRAHMDVYRFWNSNSCQVIEFRIMLKNAAKFPFYFMFFISCIFYSLN